MLLGVLFAAGLALVVLPGALGRCARRIDPAGWAQSCATALVTGTVAIELALVGQAAPTVLRTFGVTALADACERMVGAWVPGGPVAGWAAAGAAATLPALVLIGVRRTRASWARVYIEPGLGHRRLVGGIEAAVIPTDRAIAYSVRSRGQGQIVVSRGLLDRLERDPLDAVVRHEHAHLALRHDRYLLAGAAVEHALVRLRPVRASVAALGEALERWADEAATGTSGERRRHLRAAILGVAAVESAEPIAALRSAAVVAERVDALASPPLRPKLRHRLATYLPLGAASLAGTVAFGVWLGQLPAVVAMARCPIT